MQTTLSNWAIEPLITWDGTSESTVHTKDKAIKAIRNLIDSGVQLATGVTFMDEQDTFVIDSVVYEVEDHSIFLTLKTV